MKKYKSSNPLFKVAKFLIRFFFQKNEVIGLETLPTDEPVIFVGNHTQMNGPLVAEFYIPNRYTWCNAEMMKVREVPAYAYKDFWSEKPKWQRPFYKLLSYIVAIPGAFILSNANTIPVYRDTRILTTFRQTVETLSDGMSVVIFPECPTPNNNIVYEFQKNFVDVARPYYKKTGKEVLFVPIYIAPTLKKSYIGKPIRYSHENAPEDERIRITEYLSNEITEMARSLPLHTVVPYKNLPKKLYPKNKETL